MPDRTNAGRVLTPDVLTVPELDEEPGLVHGFSTLAIGSMGLTHAPDPAVVRAARRRLAEQLGLDPSTVTVIGAVHGADVARVDTPVESIDGVDGLITNTPGVALFATYADCYPILLWDPVHRAVGLAHAGWRGTDAGVARAAVAAMRDQFGSKPAEMRAAIGPGICGRCYEVGEEVASRFDPKFVRPADGGKFLLDLAAANAAQLEVEGLGEVFMLGLCTKETAYLPSHRRVPDGTRFGTIVAVT